MGNNEKDLSKQFMRVDGNPIIAYTIEAYERAQTINEIVIVAREEELLLMSDVVKEYDFHKVTKIVKGGGTRLLSVKAGIDEISGYNVVAIHDGARPFVKSAKIDMAVEAASEFGGAALGVPVKDTLKMVDGDGFIKKTLDRSNIYQIQTPQVFNLDKFKTAIELAIVKDINLTDDCQIFENINLPVKVITGDYDNIKITYPEDLLIAEGIVEGMKNV